MFNNIKKAKLFFLILAALCVFVVVVGFINLNKIIVYVKCQSDYDLDLRLHSFDFTVNELTDLSCNSIKNHTTVFNAIRKKEKDKLITFLSRNNFKIQPGRYRLNYNDDFESIVDKLAFASI